MKRIPTNSIKSTVAEDDFNYQNVTRHIPTGSKVITEMHPKGMKITIIQPFSAPPLTTDGIKGIDRSLFSSVDQFISDLKKGVKLKKSKVEPYIHMEGVQGAIHFRLSFTLEVNSKPEMEKLTKLDEELAFPKKRKL